MKIQPTDEERDLLTRVLTDFITDTKDDICGWGLNEDDYRDIELAEAMLTELGD